MYRISFLCFLFLVTLSVQAQRVLTGYVSDAETKEALLGANVVVKGTTTGTATDVSGKFSLSVGADAKTLIISYVGYTQREVNITASADYVIALQPATRIGDEVVVTSSRVSESIRQASVQIEKMTTREIKSSASGDFYQGLGNYKGIDIVTSSAGWKTINLRGFGDTRSLRTKQFIDGVDNESPGLNFPVSNLVGANDLDLDNVEIVSGAASALYGANAMQGVINMTSKDPYTYQGVAVQMRGGFNTVPGPYVDAQMRWASTFGKEKRWAFKVTGQWTQTEDWRAQDQVANRYGVITTDQNVTEILRAKQYDPITPDFTQEDKDQIIKLNAWLDFNPAANPGVIKIQSPGYMEEDLADYKAKNGKATASLHYRFKNDMELMAVYKFGFGTAVYQSTARYQIKNFTFHQPKIELKGKNFFVRTYAAIEDAGDSYNMGLAAAYTSREAVKDYVGNFVDKYFDVMDTLTGFCADCIGADQWSGIVAQANAQAVPYAQSAWYQPGGNKFDSLFNALIQDANSLNGAKFFDRSVLWHIEGQYNHTFKRASWLDLITGGSYRLYLPNSQGTIFNDTAGKKITVHEFGIYSQATARLFEDKLRIIASLRVDKNTNFEPQISPRVSLVYSPSRHHTFRAGWTMAFRTPTLQDQYLLVDIGRISLLGNLNGYDNLYTLNSVTDFYNNGYDPATGNYNTSLLKPITLDPLKPERVMTGELGWRGDLFKRLYVDLSGYVSYYTNFIGQIRVVRPSYGFAGSSEAQQAEYAQDAIILSDSSDNKYYTRHQMWVNSKTPVLSWGGGISLSYAAGRGIVPYVNYTYTDLRDQKSDDPILPGFNTPKHKINVGVNGNKVWKGLGFSANFKWVTDYTWESPFGDGPVPSFHTLDLQLNYEIEKIYTTIRLGGSNIYNNLHIEAFGSPMIGALYYVGFTFDMNNLNRKKD